MSNLKLINYKATITIHEIHITVKFPCSVFVNLKDKDADSKSNPTLSEFRVEKGCAIVNQQLVTDLTLKNNPKLGLFSQQKISLVVYLKSSSGRIPAGSANIVVKSDKEENRISVGIEKCPDRNAKIVYSLKLKYINEEQCLDQSFLSRSSVQIPVINSRTQCRTPSVRDRQILRDHGESIRKNTLKSEMFSSRVSSQRNYFPDDRSEKSETGSNSRISRIIMKQHEMQANSQRQKIIQLQKQKSKAMKQIRSLKHQLQTASLKNSHISQHQDHFMAQKRQSRIIMLQQQVDKQKNKTSEYRTQLHKSKLKHQETQKDLKIADRKCKQLEQQLKSHVQEKQGLKQKNKEINIQLRELKQKYQDNVLAYENTVKRSQFKQNVYRQQIKTLNEKYAASEAQKQKLLFQKSQLLNDLQRKELKEKQAMRDRERHNQEQKNKLIKRNDSLEHQILTIREQKQQIDQKLLQLQLEHHKLKLQYTQGKNTIDQLQTELTELKLQLHEQRNKKHVSSMEIVDRDQIFQLKKNIQEKEGQITERDKVIGGLESNKKYMEELEGTLKSRQVEIAQLQQQLSRVKQSKYQGGPDITFMTNIQNGQQSEYLPYFPNPKKQPIKNGPTLINKPTTKPQPLHHPTPNQLLQKIAKLSQQNQQLCQQNFLVSSDLLNAREQLQALQNKYKEDQAKIYELELDLQGAESLREQNLELSRQIDAVLGIKTQLEEIFQRQMKEKANKINQLECQLIALKNGKQNDNLSVIQQLQQSQNTLNHKEQQIRLLQIQLMHASDHIKILQQSSDYQLSENNKLQSQLQTLKNKQKTQEEKLQADQKQLLKMRDRVGMLQREINRTDLNEKKYIQCLEQLKQRQKDIQQLVFQLQTLRNTTSSINKSQNNLQPFKQQLNNLLPTKYRLPQTSNIHPNAILLQIQQMISEQEQQQQTLIHKIHQLQEKQEQKQSQKADRYEQKVNRYEQKYKQKQKQSKQLMMNVYNYQREVFKLKEQIDDLKVAKRDLVGQLANKDIKIQQLQVQITNLQQNNQIHPPSPTKIDQNLHILQQLHKILPLLPQQTDRQTLLTDLQQHSQILHQLPQTTQKNQIKQLNKCLQKLKLHIISVLNSANNPNLKSILNQFRELQMVVDRIGEKC